MAKSDQIIIIDKDEISLFIDAEVLSPLEASYSISCFSTVEEAMYFIKESSFSPEITINLLIGSQAILNDKKSVKLIKEALALFSSRFCLLSTVQPMQEREFIQEIDFSSHVQKPLTVEKFLKALNTHSDSKTSK